MHKEDLKKIKYSKNDEEENYKIYELEAEYLEKEKATQHLEQN